MLLLVGWNVVLPDLLPVTIRVTDVITGSYLHLHFSLLGFSIMNDEFECTLHGEVPDETTSYQTVLEGTYVWY